MNEVIIIGGGPAGSVMGCYLSKMGIPNVILEANHHPRPHVGESMVPSTTRVYKDIGFLPVLEREGFVHKYGASWHDTAGNEADIWFNEFPQDGIDQEYTYHGDRGKLDMLLLKHAHSLGSEVIQGATVKQVLFDENQCARGVRVRIADQEGPPAVVTATWWSGKSRRCRGCGWRTSRRPSLRGSTPRRLVIPDPHQHFLQHGVALRPVRSSARQASCGSISARSAPLRFRRRCNG